MPSNLLIPHRRRAPRAAAVAVAAAAALALTTGTAAATTVTPTYIAGNPTCADLHAGWQQAKLDFDPAPGVYTEGDVTVTITKAADGSLGWSTSGFDIAAVLMKGGPNANEYLYPGASDFADSGLFTPTNPNNGKPYGISHVSFCYGPPVGDSPQPEPQPTPTPTPGPTPDVQPATASEPTPAAAPAAVTAPQPEVLAVEVTRTEPAPTADVAGTALAVTGSSTKPLAAGGIGLVAAGAVLELMARRRRNV